jgi:hypothetical protein
LMISKPTKCVWVPGIFHPAAVKSATEKVGLGPVTTSAWKEAGFPSNSKSRSKKMLSLMNRL